MSDIPEFAAPQTIHEAVKAIADEIGERARVSISIQGKGIHASIWPDGVGGKAEPIYARLSANPSWPEIIAELRSKWAEHGDRAKAELTRRMALKIIELTADRGECSDADLRMTFSQQDLDRYGEAAVESANEMAANGPFTIIRQRGANAA